MKEFNKHYKDVNELQEDCYRKLAVIGNNLDKSAYEQLMADKVHTEGPYRKVITKTPERSHSNKSLF